MKGLLVLATLTLLPAYPVLASLPPSVFELEAEQPQILDQRQLEEYQEQRDAQLRQFNGELQQSLEQTYANKEQWQDIWGEIESRRLRIEQDRNIRVPRLPIR